MSHALALQSAGETKWTVKTGSMAGAVRLMGRAGFTIGRSPENEFVIISDPKCSRKHASVAWTSHGCEITTMNNDNPVLVNGREITSVVLNDGDVVTLGETDVVFNLTNAPNGLSLVEPNTMIMSTSAMPDYAGAPAPRRRSKKSSRKESNPARMGIIAVVVIGVIIALLPDGKKKAALAIRTEQQIKDEIDAANKLAQAAQSLPGKKLEETVTGRQAQSSFVSGFRDYRRGQFERSIGSFQACLALNPSHSLCNRYLRLAQRRFNEVVQYNMVLGRRYRDQNQYKACRSSFRNVIVMVKDANSAAYKEAKANYDACNAMVEGRY